MNRQPVESSAIKSIGHEGDVLEVEMKSGKVYRYSGVAREHFDALLGAESIGKHFGQHVRGKFEHTLVEQDNDGARGWSPRATHQRQHTRRMPRCRTTS